MGKREGFWILTPPLSLLFITLILYFLLLNRIKQVYRPKKESPKIKIEIRRKAKDKDKDKDKKKAE